MTVPKRRLRPPDAGPARTARTAAAQNPTTITAALGLVLGGVGVLLGWSAEVQAATAQITLGTALLVRLTVLAWKNARAS